MTRRSAPDLLVLHAVRLLGFADRDTIAARSGISHDETLRLLHDAESAGWVQHVTFADLDGWSLTDTGKAENERQLTTERENVDPEGVIAATYREFLPLNARLLSAVTDWQITPTRADRFAPNDHSDTARDQRILQELASLDGSLAPLIDRLVGVLSRFDGYAGRYHAALQRALSGEHAWIDKTDVDSCHRVWFQLHEDLVATLGIDRRTEDSGGTK